MPICISPDLPAFHILSEENIFVMDSDRAAHQDIRPLRVLVLNLMPYQQEHIPEPSRHILPNFFGDPGSVL